MAACLGFGPSVQAAATATSPTKRPLSPDHPNPALPITEVIHCIYIETPEKPPWSTHKYYICYVLTLTTTNELICCSRRCQGN